MSDARVPARTIGAVIVCLLALTSTLVACTSKPATKVAGTTSTGKKSSAPPFTVAYAHEQEFNSYNNNTATQASVANSVVLNQILPGFWYAGPNGEAAPNPEFGTVERVTGNPLTVRYTFNSKAVWSDGNAIDCDDAVLAWAANSGRWPTGKRDPITGAKLTAFSSARPGAWANVSAPKCANGDRSFTVTYNTVYADWGSLFGPGTILPAHIVEKESGVKDIIAAVRSGQTKKMIKVGDVYDSLWVFRPGQYKSEISPSAGPYQVSAWKAGQSITLKPNPKWWGAPPRAAALVIKFIPQDRQVAALRSGSVQVIDPPPSTDLLAQLKEAGPAIKASTYDSFTWEHLDFNFRSEFRSRALREAFAKCLPRQQIVDNLIKPQNPGAQILQSRFLMPFQPGYSKIANAGGQAYDSVDIAGAKKLLRSAGKAKVRVRIAYQTPNPRRKAEVDLIREFCGQAGFKVVDAGTPYFFGGSLDRGDFDVALFAWAGSPLVTQAYTTYITGGVQNKGHYSSGAVDQLLKRLYSELSLGNQLNLEGQLDQALWSDLATIPLFAFPALLATTNAIKGVSYNPNYSDVTYNANTWTMP